MLALHRLSTFARWPMPDDVCPGITNFATKCAAAHFERSAECVDDEVVCVACGLKFKGWNNESPVAVHRVISPNCTALNPAADDSQLNAEDESMHSSHLKSLQDNPYLKYLPDRIQRRVSDAALISNDQETPHTAVMTNCQCVDHSMSIEQEAAFRSPVTASHSANFPGTQRVRRELFPGDETQHPSQEDLHCSGSDSENSHSTFTQSAALRVLDHSFIKHPFKTKVGGYDSLFSSHRQKTFPQSCDMTRYLTYAEEGFIFRQRQQDMMCVYCGTVLATNEHQPRVAHEKACPTCPFVMGFDVGNISLQQEKDIKLKYFNQQAASKEYEFDFTVKYPQYEKECDRKGSFKSWPKVCEKTLPSSGMVTAGFYYSGHSDKVVCYCCGVELADWNEAADVWKIHAAVSPSCLHVINKKGEDFINRAANHEVLVEVQYPNDTKRGFGNSQKGMGRRSPGSSQLDTSAIETAFARRYPNETMLIAIMKGDSEYQATVSKQQQLVLQKDTQLQQKDTQLQQKDTQLQRFSQTVQTYQQQLVQKDTAMAAMNSVMIDKDEQLTIQGEELNRLDEQIHLKDQQIRSLMRQVQQLRTDRHHNVDDPAARLQGNDADENNLRAENDELRERLACSICESDNPRMFFLPCGHLYCCAVCTTRLQDRQCPVCRQDIFDVLPAFVA